MASVTKYPGGYRVQVCIKRGEERIRESATFRTKREAEAWAYAREAEIRGEGKKPASAKYTLADALNRYAKEESPKRRGVRWETVRIAKFLRDPALNPNRLIGEVTAADLSLWRDRMLTQVGNSTVRREMALLAAVFETARREWLWIEKNPVRDVRQPKAPDHRERLITLSETRAMLKVMGYPFPRCNQVSHAAAAVFLMGLRTGMRAGEICKLKWVDVKDDHLVITGQEVGAGKTGKRIVPMFDQVRRLLKRMEGWDDVYVFAINTASLDALFRRYRERAGLSGFTFHDTRHTATTRLAKQVDVLTLCKILGWKGTKQALTYYNPTPEQILKQIKGKRNQMS